MRGCQVTNPVSEYLATRGLLTLDSMRISTLGMHGSVPYVDRERHYKAIRQLNGILDRIFPAAFFGSDYHQSLKIRGKHLDQLDDLATNLLNEVFPDKATDAGLLQQWEELCGLRDFAYGSIDDRRNAVVAVLRSKGKANRKAFEDIARTLGYPVLQYPNVAADSVTIVEGSQQKGFRTGFSRTDRDRIYDENSTTNEHTVTVYGTVASTDDRLKYLFNRIRIVGINFIFLPV